MKGISKRLVLLAATGLFSAALLVGCGDDGDDGKDGAPGKDGKDVAVKSVESCSVCHGDGKSAGVDTAHGLANFQDVVVSNIVPANVGGNLQVSFNVKVNGANKTSYTKVTTAYRLDSTLTRRSIDLTTAQLVHAGNGNYTLTIPGGGAWTDSRYLVRIEEATSASTQQGRRAVVLFDFGASPKTDVLGVSTSCNDCHGNIAIHGGGYATPSYGGKTCVVCHDAVADFKVDGTDNSADSRSAVKAPRLPAMIHGIHKSGTMPTGKYQVVRPDGTTGTTAEWGPFEIHYPSYMQNCSVCHQSGAPLTAANNKPVTYDFCMTCHQNWDGYGDGSAISFHKSMTAATNCATCHDGATAPANVGAMHNNGLDHMYTERGGLVYDGVDLSVSEGAKTVMTINEVKKVDNNLVIKWGATFNGVATDPCFVGPATSGKPAFAGMRTVVDHGTNQTLMHNFSFLKSFFVGDDVVNGANGNASPGQPNSVNVVFPNQPASTAGGTVPTPNTTCTATEATTTLALTAAEQALAATSEKLRVGLQGKPVLKHDASNRWYYLRAKSPVYDLDLKANAKAATYRRGSTNQYNSVTETDKCLKCHVGSLYQHGGNRVDNVELCIMCHNEASSEQNVRFDTYGIKDASKTYDGKIGQTYGLKTMLHRVHASGSPYVGNKPFVIYRGMGIYGFALNEAVLISWPGTGSQTVANSDPPKKTPHNFATAHYPRPLNDCLACHASNFSKIPDATKAVATTIDAGVAPWDNQLDDKLKGPAAAACTSCHVDSATAAHTEQFGWTPSAFEKGRQTLIDAAKQ